MTIKKRLFLSNLFMLLIPAMVSVLILAVSLLFFVNVVYKQVMDETVREENTVHLEHLLMEQAKEFLQTNTGNPTANLSGRCTNLFHGNKYTSTCQPIVTGVIQ